MTFSIVFSLSSPRNGDTPLNKMYVNIPTHQISVAVDTSSCFKISGAIKGREDD